MSAAGRQGQGPHEFRTPLAIANEPAGNDVWVSDFGKAAFLQVAGPEDDWREIPLPRDSVGPLRLISFDNLGLGFGRQWLVKLGAGLVLGRSRPGSSGSQALWNADVVLLDSNSGTLIPARRAPRVDPAVTLRMD